MIDKGITLSNRQFDFRKPRLTVDATKVVMELARRAVDEGRFCALVALNTGNAFNFTGWNGITEALTAAQMQTIYYYFYCCSQFQISH